MKNLKLHIEIAKMQNLERGCLLYCRLGMENQTLRQLKIFVCLPPTSVSGCTGITNTVLPVLLIPVIVTEKLLITGTKQAVIEALQKSPRECGFNKSNWTMPLLKRWINKQWGINYKASSLYKLVHKFGFTLQGQRTESECQ